MYCHSLQYYHCLKLIYASIVPKYLFILLMCTLKYLSIHKKLAVWVTGHTICSQVRNPKYLQMMKRYTTICYSIPFALVCEGELWNRGNSYTIIAIRYHMYSNSHFFTNQSFHQYHLCFINNRPFH